MTRWIATPVLSLALAGLLVACGGDDDGGGGSNTAPADADVVVRAVNSTEWDEDGYATPGEGGEVEIYAVNDTTLAHNLYVQNAVGDNIGDAIDLPGQGSTGEVTLKLEPGEYRILCLVPGHQNMDSTLNVG